MFRKSAWLLSLVLVLSLIGTSCGKEAPSSADPAAVQPQLQEPPTAQAAPPWSAVPETAKPAATEEPDGQAAAAPAAENTLIAKEKLAPPAATAGLNAQEPVPAQVSATKPPPARATTSTLTLGQAVSRRLQVTFKITNIGETAAENVRLEIPLMAAIDSPYQVLVAESLSHAAEIKEEDWRNRMALICLPVLPAGATETITGEYVLQVYPLHALLATAPAAEIPPALAAYLQPAPGIESDHPAIAAKAEELTAGLNTDADKARALFRFVLKYLKYDHQSPARNRGALAALQSGSGVCEEYASLFVALCRAAGIPARLVNGYADPRGTGESWHAASGNRVSLRGYRHSWAEFYLEGAGWLPADPTMNLYTDDLVYFGSLPRASHIAQNYVDQSMRVRYQGGKLSATWEEALLAP